MSDKRPDVKPTEAHIDELIRFTDALRRTSQAAARVRFRDCRAPRRIVERGHEMVLAERARPDHR